MVDLHLITFIDWLSNVSNFDLEFTSGYRCPECNQLAGGSKNSAHTRGLAVDIAIKSSAQRYDIIFLAMDKSIRRIGVYKNHIHIDIDASLPQNVMWFG